jgi:hypothetical protein
MVDTTYYIKFRETRRGNNKWTMETLAVSGTEDTGRKQAKNTTKHRKLKR